MPEIVTAAPSHGPRRFSEPFPQFDRSCVRLLNEARVYYSRSKSHGERMLFHPPYIPGNIPCDLQRSSGAIAKTQLPSFLSVSTVLESPVEQGLARAKLHHERKATTHKPQFMSFEAPKRPGQGWRHQSLLYIGRGPGPRLGSLRWYVLQKRLLPTFARSEFL